MDKRIKIIVLEGLDVSDVVKLKQGGFFDGAHTTTATLPGGVTGQEAVLVRPGDTIALRAAQQMALGKMAVEVEVTPPAPVASGYDANAREAVEKAEAAQLAAVEAIKQKVEAKADGTSEGLYPSGLFPHEIPQPESKPARRKREKAEDRAVERAANAASEPAPAPAPVVETPAAPAPVVEAPAAEGDTDIDTEKLGTFTKLRDLLQYLIDAGIPPEGAATFCETVKAEVPLLSRITNIEERVTRTLEVMGLVQ